MSIRRNTHAGFLFLFLASFWSSFFLAFLFFCFWPGRNAVFLKIWLLFLDWNGVHSFLLIRSLVAHARFWRPIFFRLYSLLAHGWALTSRKKRTRATQSRNVYAPTRARCCDMLRYSHIEDRINSHSRGFSGYSNIYFEVYFFLCILFRRNECTACDGL